MPTYEFYCTNKDCNHKMEIFCLLKERPEEIRCESCGAQSKYGVSAQHFVVKGASYANGYCGPSNYIGLDKINKKV